MPLPCVVLGGGMGLRMRPVTERLPKALLQVAGRPFAELQLEWLRREGVHEVIYCVGHLGWMIREQLGDGRRLGVTIDYVDEGEALMGTAGALRLAYDKGVLPATFFVLYGDSYLSVELEAVARDFAARSALALMTVLRNENRWGRSNVIVGDGMVQVYEPDAAVPHPGMRWIDYGVSVLRREIVAARVDRERPAALSALWQQLSRAAELVAFEVVDRFFEIGSPAGLAELEAHLTG